jgi:uncharacterized protein (TIGR02453 family)
VAFSGFPAEAVAFYEGLAADNSRTYWQEHKRVYEQSVRAPMDELLAELAPFGPFHVFRPNRDVRFAKDKSPYKENIAAFGEGDGGTGYYVHFSTAGMLAGSGYYNMLSDQLERFRGAVDDDVLGPQIDEIVRGLERKGLRAGAMDTLKTAPRGYPKDHPRIELLRRKGLMVSREWPMAAWMRTKAVVGRVRDVWTAAAPMNEWLDAHVGPSTLPPEEGPGWRR